LRSPTESIDRREGFLDYSYGRLARISESNYASRSGVPIEVVSKVILRHANLSTTQRYLGKNSDTEATRWVENLYG
jgi:hypothetical protein